MYVSMYLVFASKYVGLRSRSHTQHINTVDVLLHKFSWDVPCLTLCMFWVCVTFRCAQSLFVLWFITCFFL